MGTTDETRLGTAENHGRLGELHAATRRLMRADDRAAVFTVASESATDVLGFPGTGIREYDPDGDLLRHVGFGGRVGDVSERPAYPVDDSPHGRAFRAGETLVTDIAADDSFGREVFSQTMYVPLGEYGVLSAGVVDSEFTERDISLAEVLAANTHTALERVEERRQLEEERERLDEFASVVAHDLQSPMSAARGFVDLVTETGNPDFAADARSALDRMDRIVDEVLTLARDGRTVDDLSTVELRTAAREAWESVEVGDLSLTVRDDTTLAADPERLRHVFENLFVNAALHGEDATTITVGTRDAGFFVADDGVGIAPDERDAVFETGYSTSPDGTGFGLSIVRRIAHAHGWTVVVDSATDGGTCISFEQVALGDG
ncbi:sensor histidine kinase [Haloarchaeobius sp. DFWS5]|uniref:sensor histidine kinase n=1 Tax=Haloarchaeobius sp. DFWS5 TaxID=3446114 RepID=UPI003EBAB756